MITRKLLPTVTLLLFTRGLEMGLAVTYLFYVVAAVQTTDFAWFFCPCVRVCQGASLVAQMVKTLPAMQETWVWSLGWEDPLKKEMATHSSVLAWRIPWTEEPSYRLAGYRGGLATVHGVAKVQRVRHDWATNMCTCACARACTHTHTHAHRGMSWGGGREHRHILLLNQLLLSITRSYS